MLHVRGIGLLLVLAAVACDSKPAPAPSAAASSAATQAAPGPAPASAAASPDDARVAKARQLTERFQTALKAELMKGMSQGGPAAAIEVCSARAPAIAKELELEPGWTIERTALKLRNPNNAPDDWERAMLEQLERMTQQGIPMERLEVHEVVERDGKRVFRYLKAIPTVAMCLDCHGSQQPREVAEKLAERYPKDQAVGFSVGDIRGAFSVENTL